MRTGTLLLVVAVQAGCQLNADYADLGDSAITSSSPATTSEGAPEEPPTTSYGPVETVTGADEPGASGKISIDLVAVDSEVGAAGPLPIVVETRHADEVELRLDGGGVGKMMEDPADSEHWSHTLAILGGTPDGEHTLEVVARNATQLATREVSFVLAKPDGGTVAWSKPIDAPPGTTNALAITPEGDVIEAGAASHAGSLRPSVRRRSGDTGQPRWEGETIVLWPELAGEAAGVAVAPDGTIWVATNVGPANQPTRPRLVHLDPSGQPLGPYLEGAEGQTMTAVAATEDGGCVAVGATPDGTQRDGKLWFVGAAGEPLSEPVWTYEPQVGAEFDEVLLGLAVVGDEVVVVGQAEGFHDGQLYKKQRAVLARLSRTTGDALGLPWVAPPDVMLTQSRLRSVVPNQPDGWVAAGDACDDECVERRLEVGVFSAAGERLELLREDHDSTANGVAVDSQGRVVTAATVVDNGFDARLQARELPSGHLAFGVDYPGAAASDEEALAVVVDAYDRIYYGGYARGADAQPRAFVARVHP